MASVIGKMINGKLYYYLAVSARVDGKPRIVEQKYLGSAEDIEAAVSGAAVMPARTRHLGFGDLAAAWGVLEKLGWSGSLMRCSAGAGWMRALRWAPTWPWRGQIGWSTRAPSCGLPTGGPPLRGTAWSR